MSHTPLFPDAMIDIEGCSDLPDAAPHQIAVVLFDLDDPSREPLPLSRDVEVLASLRLGFSITAATLTWWADQLAKPVDLEQGDPLRGVLKQIASFLKDHATPDARIWSRGNSYDLSILKLAYHRCGFPLPWKYWRERDVRTHLDALGYEKRSSNPHVALQDALNQIQDLHAARSPQYDPTPTRPFGGLSAAEIAKVLNS